MIRLYLTKIVRNGLRLEGAKEEEAAALATILYPLGNQLILPVPIRLYRIQSQGWLVIHDRRNFEFW